MQRRRLWCHWYFLPMRTKDHSWPSWKLTPDKFAEKPKSQKGRKKDAKRALFASSVVSQKSAQVVWNEWRGRRDPNPRPLP